VTESEISHLNNQLFNSLPNEELVSLRRRVERSNEQAAQAQIALTFLVMARAIELNKDWVDLPDLFWPVFEEWQDRTKDKPRLAIPKLPADELGRLRPLVLFDIPENQIGADVQFLATRLFLDTATDAVYRLVDSLKEAKGTLETERVLRRLRSEAERAQDAARGAT
jgi:hypothetical protein